MICGKYVALALTGMVLCLSSGTGYGLVNYDGNPDLALAMKYDPVYGDANDIDRGKAEEYYLRCLQTCREPFQRARVYETLGAMFAVPYKPSVERDLAKGCAYFQKVLEAEPNRIGSSTLRARSILCEISPDCFERLKARIAFYKWLSALDSEKVRNNWLPLRPGGLKPQVVKEKPGASGEVLSRVTLTPDDPNRPTGSELTGMMRLTVSLKSSTFGNAVTCDAPFVVPPERALAYLREQFSVGSHERTVAEESLAGRSQSGLPATANLPRPSYEIDPSLREAWRQYLDTKGRNRESVRSLFEAYLAKEPNSPFRAEVYYLMGALYSNNIIPELGEKMDLPLAK
jgi:hypothetical protein